MFLWIFPGIAFVLSLILTPYVAAKLREKGIVAPDLHKEDRPLVPELVGVSLLASFMVAIALAYLFVPAKPFINALVVVTLVGLMGILDHYRPLIPREKILGLSGVGVLYFYLSSNYSQGLVQLVLISIAFMAVCNFTNMLAGFNGLEIGVGAIASGGVAVVALLHGSPVAFVIASVMGASLLAFLYYNRYPARVFPGDVGTLIIGAALFVAVHTGGLYLPGVIIFLPYLIDAGLKFISAGIMSRHGQRPTKIINGKLYPPGDGNLSLARLLLQVRPLEEKRLVGIIWGIAVFFALMAIGVEVIL